VRLASNGRAGVQIAQEFEPEIVLLDIGLPDLDGFEVCRRIRSEPWGRRMRIVALTGWGEDRDRARAHEVGFDAHLVKPLEHETLLAILAAPPTAAETVQPGIDSTR
jgi:DNA-binding response OmpR family regulator